MILNEIHGGIEDKKIGNYLIMWQRII